MANHQFALKQDVRTPDGDGIIRRLERGGAIVELEDGCAPWFRQEEITIIDPKPKVVGQAIEVSDGDEKWQRGEFIAVYKDMIVVETEDGLDWFPRWRFIPDTKPSAFTEEQLAELDARYARREDA